MPFDVLEIDTDSGYLLNGRPLPSGKDRKLIEDWVDEQSLDFPTDCPYCGSKLRSAGHEDTERSPCSGLESQEAIVVAECPCCAFSRCEWRRDGETSDGCPPSTWVCQLSRLAEYPDQLPYQCHTELAQHLKRHPDAWHSLSPKRMELLVADIFRANHRAAEAMHVGSPNDGGVDVIFIDSDEARWLVQVKSHVRSDPSEGVGTVRNLLGTILLDGTLNGIVVTNADHFTYRAFEAASRASERGYRIRLVDKGKLNRMLDPMLPYGQWREFLRRHRPDLVGQLGAGWPNPDQLTLDDYLPM